MKGAGMKGFTLIELLITVAILAVLASAALPLAELTVQRGKEQDLRRSLREIREAIDAYKRATEEGAIDKPLDKTGYPPTLAVLSEGAVDKRDPKGKRIYFLRRVPADPVSGEPWGLRSYASSPDAPKDGDDVFDVYSKSDANGLNGVPYKEW
jgi:general secretion pathway protein G